MVERAPRFCPRCGAARVADMPFCAGCGLNFAEYETPSAVGAGAEGKSIDVPPPSDVSAPTETGPPIRRRLGVPPIVMTAAIVVVAVIALALLTGRFTGGSPGSGGQATAVADSGQPAAPIVVGLTILSPTDGQVVASKDVVVLVTAPPGLTITQDISFGFDQHTTVDGTGHWAIKVGLNDGDNKLTFRIGDDHSTQQTIRVIYTPTQTP